MAPTAPDEAKLAHAAELLNAKNWPIPRWHAATKPNKIQTYEEYFTFQLRARYTELENDFRAILGNFPNDADLITATRIEVVPVV